MADSRNRLVPFSGAHSWAQIHLFVSLFPFQNDRLERSLQTTSFSILIGTKKRERSEVFKHEE
jgi:hypothetical protein